MYKAVPQARLSSILTNSVSSLLPPEADATRRVVEMRWTWNAWFDRDGHEGSFEVVGKLGECANIETYVKDE